MVNSARTMAHLTQPASLARAMALKGLTPRSKVKTSPEEVPPLLRGTLALPGAPNEADRLLGKLSGALEALKANPDEMDALRLRVRDGPARELQKKLKAKEEKIQELERELKNARAAQGTHSGAGADAIPHAALTSQWLERVRQRLRLGEETVGPQGGEGEQWGEDVTRGEEQVEEQREEMGSTPPRTPLVERPFGLSPTTHAPGTAFLVAAFAEEKELEQQAQQAQQAQRQGEEANAKQRTSGRAVVVSASEAANEHIVPRSARDATSSISTRRPHATTDLSTWVRPGTAPRFTVKASQRAAMEAADAKERAVAAAKTAGAMSAEAAAKAARAAEVKGCDTSGLSPDAAWSITKAPREAAAAARAANAARVEAENAALASRRAELGELAHHENEHVRYFSRAPAQALSNLATFVQNERELTHRHGAAIGDALALCSERASERATHWATPALPVIPLAERVKFTSDVVAVPLAMPHSPFRRRATAARTDTMSPGLVRSRA